MGIRTKLIIALLGMALLPLVLSTVILVRSNTWRLANQARDFRLAVADGARRSIENFIGEASTELNTLGSAFLRSELGLEKIKALVKANLKGARLAHQVALYTTEGKLVVGYRAEEKKQWFKPPQTLPKSVVQIAPTLSFVHLKVQWKNNRPFLPMLMPLFKDAARKQPLGLVWTMIDLTPLSKLVGSISYRRFDKNPANVYLVNSSFKVLAFYKTARVGTTASKAISGSGVNFKKDIGIALDDTIGGKDYLVAVIPMISVPWAVVVQQPRDRAYAAIRNTTKTALLVGIGFTILAILGGLLIGRRLSSPILAVAGAAHKVARGDFEVQVPTTSKDEVGKLANSFNQMTRDLKAYRGTLVRETEIRANLSRYLSADLVEQIVERREELKLGGERKEITVLFADVVSFTPMAENLPPETIVGVLNELFTYLTEIIFRHGGTVDKFMGDCVMAVFGAPKGHDDDPLRAVRAAEEMMSWLDVGNARWKGQLGTELALGIGINTGEAVAGNIGSEKRMEYTVIGDAVNVAARLESLAKPGQILISRATMERVSDEFDTESLGQHDLFGRSRPVELFAIDL